MPVVQVAIAEIGQKATKAGNAAEQQGPPNPGFSYFERKRRQPQVDDRDRDERAAEADAIMEHEVNDPTFIDTAKFLREHPQECRIVRQKMPGRGLKYGERARKPQAQ